MDSLFGEGTSLPVRFFIAFVVVFALIGVTLTIATVNNGDMIRMQGLTDEFTKANPDIAVKWVTLEENVLRQKVTTDIATKGGQFDVLTIGTYEVPIWAGKEWLVPLDNLGADYDVDDLLPKIRAALSTGAALSIAGALSAAAGVVSTGAAVSTGLPPVSPPAATVTRSRGNGSRPMAPRSTPPPSRRAAALWR